MSLTCTGTFYRDYKDLYENFLNLQCLLVKCDIIPCKKGLEIKITFSSYVITVLKNQQFSRLTASLTNELVMRSFPGSISGLVVITLVITCYIVISFRMTKNIANSEYCLFNNGILCW